MFPIESVAPLKFQITKQEVALLFLLPLTSTASIQAPSVRCSDVFMSGTRRGNWEWNNSQ
jgi:hypothetical protein